MILKSQEQCFGGPPGTVAALDMVLEIPTHVYALTALMIFNDEKLLTVLCLTKNLMICTLELVIKSDEAEAFDHVIIIFSGQQSSNFDGLMRNVFFF